MPIKAVIWDLGGVIVRTEDSAFREELAADFGVARATLEHSVFGGDTGDQAQRGEITTKELWDAISKSYNLTDEGISNFQKRFFGGDAIDHELIDFIRSLKLNYTTALLSNAWDNLRYMITKRWNFADAFDTMIVSAEEGIMKPDARIYQIALDRVSVAPQHAVFIDDFPHNIVGAQAVGMHGILFEHPEQVKTELAKLLK